MDYKPSGRPLLRNLCSFSQKDAKFYVQNSSFLARMPGIRLAETPIAPQGETIPEHGRLLVVTPRRVGSACVRNRIRRRIRSIYFEKQLYQRKSVVIAFTYPEMAQLSFEELSVFFVKMLTKRPLKAGKSEQPNQS